MNFEVRGAIGKAFAAMVSMIVVSTIIALATLCSMIAVGTLWQVFKMVMGMD